MTWLSVGVNPLRELMLDEADLTSRKHDVRNLLLFREPQNARGRESEQFGDITVSEQLIGGHAQIL